MRVTENTLEVTDWKEVLIEKYGHSARTTPDIKSGGMVPARIEGSVTIQLEPEQIRLYESGETDFVASFLVGVLTDLHPKANVDDWDETTNGYGAITFKALASLMIIIVPWVLL